MGLRFNPQMTPVIRRDDHLPAVVADQLGPDALRRRFATPPAWQPDIVVERSFTERVLTPASVLVPLILRDTLTVLLTQRTDHLTDHPGQISFPGGRVEAGDADVVATALRETQEEIGLHAKDIEVLGTMPTYTTGTGFVVTPVVALIAPPLTVEVDPFEVAEVFEVPLSFLMTPAHHCHHAVEFAGAQRDFLSIPWEGRGAHGVLRRYFIWGATAAMLRNFYRFLSA